MLEPKNYLWNKLNEKLSDLCCEEIITESEMENILDDAQLLGLYDLIKMCERYNIKLPNGSYAR